MPGIATHNNKMNHNAKCVCRVESCKPQSFWLATDTLLLVLLLVYLPGIAGYMEKTFTPACYHLPTLLRSLLAVAGQLCLLMLCV